MNNVNEVNCESDTASDDSQEDQFYEYIVNFKSNCRMVEVAFDPIQ